MQEIIRTTKNKTYKHIKSLQQKKHRTQLCQYTVEGIKSVRDAICAKSDIKLVAVSESLYNNGIDIPCEIPVTIICDELFSGLCDTKTPQGIIAVIEMKDTGSFIPDINNTYIYCDGISDPGNLGTIIRCADAAGFGGVLLSPCCADLYSPKTVRASMGSFFNISTITNVTADDLSKIKELGFNLYSGALLDDSTPYTEPDYTKPTVIIIGNEANGVSDEVLNMSEHIIIPIYGKAESLNAAIAGAIIMYEVAGQRRS